jgi:hypothetical protein
MLYNVRWLYRVARAGLDDLLPAVRQAFNDDPHDDRLDLVYGERPRRNVLLIALAGIVTGSLFARFAGPEIPFADTVNWPAVAIAAVHAALIRRYLFRSKRAGPGDFTWLAASLVPATTALMLIAAGASLAEAGRGDHGAPSLLGIGSVLMAATDALAVAAALTIAVAALCFTRNWLAALRALTVRLIAFRFTVWLTTLILLEIGIVGPIISAVLHSLFEFTIPAWIPELFDQISYAALMSVIYLAVIGATWTVCRRSFAVLLETGSVDVLGTIAESAVDPATLEKQAKKREQRAQRKARKRAGRESAQDGPAKPDV